MSMLKDIAKLRKFQEDTERYLSEASDLLGEVADQALVQSLLPPLKVIKFYNVKLGDMLTRNEPKRASIGIDGEGGMYTVPDNVVSINSGKKRAERWNNNGTVRLLEIE